jgi:hypothetical protein
MAFIPRINALREQYLGESATGDSITSGGGAGVPSGTAPAGGSAPAPAPVGTGKFAAVRGFFEANQPNAEAHAAEIAKPIADQAQGAVDKAKEAEATPENFGGGTLRDDAIGDRDEALDSVNAATSPEGIAGLIGKKDATYSQGMRNADAALYGRTAPMGELSKWGPVLEALAPTSRGAIEKPGDIGARPYVWTPEEFAGAVNMRPEFNKNASAAYLAQLRQAYEKQQRDAAEWDEKDKTRKTQQDEWDEWTKRTAGG